jgi:hypothetical protein
MLQKTIAATLLAGSLLLGYCKKDLTSAPQAPLPTAALQNGPGSITLASVLWDGDANLGTGTFKTLNLENGAELAAVNNATYGKIWRFYKPAGSNRCEVHAAKGFQAAEGDDIYLGWRSQLAMPANTTTNAVFQWKAYGSNMTQNFPVVIKTNSSGNITLWHFAPGQVGTQLWNTPLALNAWNTFVLRLKVSRDATVGFIEFWYNGTKQMLSNGSQRYYARTLDAEYCDPKWGVYGASSTEIYNRVHALKIGSSYADVAP